MEKNSVLMALIYAAMALIYAALKSENQILRFKMKIFQRGLIQILFKNFLDTSASMDLVFLQTFCAFFINFARKMASCFNFRFYIQLSGINFVLIFILILKIKSTFDFIKSQSFTPVI